MKKIYLILSVVACLAALFFIATRFMPAKYITGLLGENNAASSLACSYPVRIAGEAMEPYFKNGQMAIFSKCFTANDITVDKTIAFKDGEAIRLGLVNSIENLPKGLTYKVVQPNRKGMMADVLSDQIIAVYKQKQEFDKNAVGQTDSPAGYGK